MVNLVVIEVAIDSRESACFRNFMTALNSKQSK